MKTLADWLRDGDPLSRDPALSEADAAAIRRRVVSAAVERPPQRLMWTEAVAIAAAVLVMVVAGVTTGRRLPAPGASAGAGPAETGDGSAVPGERRQLQFATPGGTRIIWTFDSEFSLKESVR